MKKGDVVTVKDGSYSQSVINGKSIHEIGIWKNRKFTVIEVGCKFPVVDSRQQRYESVERFNNTVIQAIDSGKVVFIEERFLQLVPPKHKIMIDMNQDGCTIFGKFVDISDELYRKIIDESQTK